MIQQQLFITAIVFILISTESNLNQEAAPVYTPTEPQYELLDVEDEKYYRGKWKRFYQERI